MSTGNQTRKRRFATVAQTQSWRGQLLSALRQGSVLSRIGLCGSTALILLLITRGWLPPRTFFQGQIPTRDIISKTTFEQIDRKKTDDERQRERSLALAVFENDPAELDQLWARLRNNDIENLIAAETLSDVDPQVWSRFEIPRVDESTPAPEQQFIRLKEQLAEENALETLQNALDDSLRRIRQTGLLRELPSERDFNFQLITIRPRTTDPSQAARDVAVEVENVLMEGAATRLQAELRAKIPQELADAAYRWLQDQLPVTLTLDDEATRESQDLAEQAVEPVYRTFTAEPTIDNVLAKAGEPLDVAAVERLELEYEALAAERTWLDRIGRSIAVLGLYVGIFLLCSFFVGLQTPPALNSLPQLLTLLIVVLLTVGVALLLAESIAGWQAELAPLVLFGMIAAVAYRQTLALLFSATVALVVVVGTGMGLADFLILLAPTAGAIVTLGRIRSRSKMLFVGLAAAVVAFGTGLSVGSIGGTAAFADQIIQGARLALWAVIAGSLMTCLLPLVEKIFSIQTDISLIELGDPAHPLLQELIRRAPGTYNHSITVASLAEAAADAIGARSLLVRVGAYFHDIGKMLKPGYFIENQGQGDNRHESLVPAMSTLVIIAHVKDGADLARQHRLPSSMIDFIQQHHGTTLVEYFYRRASEQQSDDRTEEIDESSFRYPGPKPQTKEVAVLMLADAVESASRVLTEPTPSRIENLVHEITMKRLLDGQFDECDLTLQEVHAVEDSLAKSLTAVYHGRVKYPEPETA